MTEPIKKRSLAEIIAEKKLLATEKQKQQEISLEASILDSKLNTEALGMDTTSYSVDAPKITIIPTAQPEKKRTLQEILAQKLKTSTASASVASTKHETPLHSSLTTKLEADSTPTNKETFSLSISLNKDQQDAVELAFAGKSFCLIGAAGTGKTTTQREIAASLLKQKKLGTHDFRIQGTQDRVTAPSIAFVAYTRIAAGNLRRAVHKNPELEAALLHNITTIHNLLEYTPEFYWDPVENKEKFRFFPRRNQSNPLDITHLVIEEASMVGLDLWENLFKAMRKGVQIIFLGDINQLPPVFGASILSYAMGQLPIVELKEVYRQEGDSLVLANAHNILNGRPLEEGKGFKILRGKPDTNPSQFKQSVAIGKNVPKWEASDEYNPLEDIFLSPWNKHDLGTDNLNKWIAQDLGAKRGAVVYEILAGITKLYLAVGDKILFNKQVGVITKIVRNGTYIGKAPLKESVTLTRFGVYSGNSIEDSLDDLDSDDYSNFSLEKILDENADALNKTASHMVDLELETGQIVTLTTVGDFNPSTFSLAYALTVHKAQGCEWRKVFIVLHKDHSVSLFRELLYTAVTRAREEVILIAKDDVINKAIKTQRMKGNTLREKIEYFNAGVLNFSDVKIIK